MFWGKQSSCGLVWPNVGCGRPSFVLICGSGSCSNQEAFMKPAFHFIHCFVMPASYYPAPVTVLKYDWFMNVSTNILCVMHRQCPLICLSISVLTWAKAQVDQQSKHTAPLHFPISITHCTAHLGFHVIQSWLITAIFSPTTRNRCQKFQSYLTKPLFLLNNFLDAEASLAPTPVSPSVGQLVGW